MHRLIFILSVITTIIGLSNGQSISDILAPRQDSLINRLVSYVASSLFDSEVIPQLEDVRFFLWTRQNPIQPVELFTDRRDILLNKSPFSRSKPVKILVHGFGGNGTTHKFSSRTRSAYLTVSDCNVITVDWSSLAAFPKYALAALSTEPVGLYLAQFIHFLLTVSGTPPSSVHIVGYSLGSHVAGAAGNHLFRLSSGEIRLARITGLEPASGGFERPEKLRPLCRDDAQFVDVIHTNANALGLGTVNPVGSADFYPNGGTWQFGCLSFTEYDSLIHCSHDRATHYFIESILIGPGKFLSTRCSSYFKFNLGACSGSHRSGNHHITSMGEYVSPQSSGVYFLRTRANSPYSIE